MKLLNYAAGLALLGVGMAQAQGAETPVLRAAMLQIGTVNWELRIIEERGLDAANGFDLEVQGMADNGATRVALAGGETDMVVADWIWVATQRAAGRDYVFIPYSTAVGSLLVPEGSAVRTLEDLRGGRVGIAGGPVDKSWLILRAYAQQEYGLDLAAETEQVFGAPPLIMRAGLSGEVDGAINFWHFLAKMEAAGMREVVSVADASEALGLDPKTPLLGYVVTEAFAEENPEIVEGLIAASREAKEILRTDDAAWESIRPIMNAEGDAEFEALKAGWIAGIPDGAAVDEAEAAKVFELMRSLGGERLVGEAETLPDGVFFDPPS